MDSESTIMTDDEVLEMVKKGCNRFIRMYPHEGKDLFQAAACAACRARQRGLEGGAMMLAVTGACKDYLNEMYVMHNHTGVHIDICDVFTIQVEAPPDDDNLDDLIAEMVDIGQSERMKERDRNLLRLIAEGYQYKEIAEILGRTEIAVKKRVELIRNINKERNAHSVHTCRCS